MQLYPYQSSNYRRDSLTGKRIYDKASRVRFVFDDWRNIMGDAPDGGSWNFAQCLACIHPDDRKRVLATFDRAIASASNLTVEFRVDHLLDDERWVLAHLEYVSPEREAPGLVVSSIDITERKWAEMERTQLLVDVKQAQQEAEAAVSLRDQVVSVAAHELRTPLTVLSGFANMLQQHLEITTTDARAQRMASKVVHQAERLNNLITQLLDVTRIQHDQFNIMRQPLDMGTLVEDVVESFSSTLPQDQPTHQIYLMPADQPLMLLGDPGYLEQVISNLLGNAVKYSPAGGTVEVRVTRCSNNAVLEVVDYGIGIPAAAQAHLFAPFYRASNAHLGASGLGIGLYLVSEIVKRHGGRIEVSSIEEKGSIFRAVLPLMADENERLERSVGLERRAQSDVSAERRAM